MSCTIDETKCDYNNVFLNAVCMEKKEDNIWFIHNNYPILFCYNLVKNKILVKKIIPISNKRMVACFSSINIIENTLFLIPNNSGVVVIYDIEKDSFQSITIECSGSNVFRDSYVFGKYIYCIPYRYTNIVKINCITLEIEYIPINHFISIIEKNLCINSICRIGEKVFCVIWETNYIISFSMETEEIDIFEAVKDNKNHKLSAICTANGFLYVYDSSSKNMYRIVYDNEQCEKVAYFCYEDVVLESNGRYIIVDSCDNLKWHIFDSFSKKTISTNKEDKLGCNTILLWSMGCYFCEEAIIYRIGVYGELCKIDENGKVIDQVYISVNRKEWQELINEIKKYKVILEEESYNLFDFVCCIEEGR